MTRVGWRDVVVALALWIAASAAAAAVGFRMEIPWADWHLLDRTVLAEHPLASLCWLHSQPPVLNVLVSVVLRTAARLGVAPESVALALFGALSTGAAILLHRVIRDLTGSRWLAAIGVALVLADPAYHVFANLFFYEFLVYVLLIAVVAASARYLEDGRPAALVALTLALGATSLTRTLFHPIWAIGVWIVVVALRTRLAPSARTARLAPVFGLLVALLMVWPAKNALVFGRFQSASLSAYSLARISRTCGLPVGYMTGDQLLSEEQSLTLRAARWCGSAGEVALTARSKSDASVNWNHATFLARAPAWQACAMDFVRTHPWDVLRKAVANYASWTQPSFLQPQLGYAIGPPSFPYLAYAFVLIRTLYYDLRPGAERLWPDWFLHREARMPNGRPIGYSLFGALLLPAALLTLTVAAVRRAHTPDGALVLVLLAIMVPPMIAACLTDGEEGNRMRFATTPMLVMGLCWLASLTRRPHDGAPPVR